jgi:hypothetical protein
MFSRRIEQDACPDDISVNEIFGRVDAPIDVRFSGEVDHRKKRMLGHECIDRVGIGDVGFEKFITLAMFFDYAIEIGKIAGVSKHIQVGHERRLVMLQNVTNKIAPDESAATGHKNAHAAK